ncbi:hypothetical protein AUK40_02625 [Candidatus Wirthbacteria bacterium CG2_30_54_11]|uniref:Methyltransferase type 11 domain-containing protein n=1 Tax=Candidatus Wirthbacteria bacterium CG2_30_54_11 TaxID=1817892 RepID=A0A1J5IX51_9BACT|nr:MAG: hypothetical protein AUK40_02625 [Candidatus Wirthbacteria bacterium CG2_30_54_11]
MAGNHFHYSKKNAIAYQTLGIDGTSYEFPYREAERILGDLKGQKWLDFGCGTGRSSTFLLQLNAKDVTAVDHDQNMIGQAVSIHAGQSITFHLIEGTIPVPDATLDGAFSSYVFMEMDSLDLIGRTMKEIARTLKPGSRFVSLMHNPAACLGHDYVSYTFPDNKSLKSGDPMGVTIKSLDPFVISDYFWTEEDYQQVLTAAGFEVRSVTFPRPTSGTWIDELIVPPGMVIYARKK